MARLPLRYNIKSITRRPLRSLLTIMGVGLAVFLSVTMLGLTKGLIATTIATGEELNVLVLSYGAESIEFSALDPQALHVLSNAAGIAQEDGVALAAPEEYINTQVKAHGVAMAATPVLVRGVRGISHKVHPKVSVSEGKLPERGFEIAVGRLVATRLGLPESAIAIGTELEFEGQRWLVNGILDAPGTAYEAEIWAPLDDLMVASKRDDYSMLVLRAGSVSERDDLLFDLRTRTDVRTTAHAEIDYYSAEANQLKPVQLVSMVMTVLLVLGGLMAGMNTMFSSVMGRLNEMAVLLVVGYRRHAVLMSYIIEGVLLCLIGGIAGCAAGMLLNGLPMKFSMSAFRFAIDGSVVALGIVLAVLIGIVGSMPPVLRVARLKAAEGLREA